MIIGHPMSDSEYKDLITLANRIRDESTRNYMTVLAEIEKKINVKAQFSAKKAYSVDVLATTVDFRYLSVINSLLLNNLNIRAK